MTDELIDALQRSGFFEREEESEKREIVLGKLNGLIGEFVRLVGRQKHLPEAFLETEAKGRLFTFGSYRLGVHQSGADIDTLCVAPQHVDRSDFFTTFYGLLEAHPEVEGLTQVPDAYVPVIKMVFAGIPIDLLFCRLLLPTIPDDLDILDHTLLRNLDEKCILSLNGARMADEILRLVPHIETFYTALRCIKFWAKRRGVYKNSMGYVGGVACALLVARICQLYPCSSAATVVSRFFKIYQQWRWPQPVILKPIEDFPLGMRVWNPRLYPQDRAHRMPVITPAYPSMCSTHSVLASNLQLMTEEFRRGADLALQIEQRKAGWEDLFIPTDFFHRYKHFFQIIAYARTPEGIRMWSGFVESKVRILVGKLEVEEHIAGAPPYPDSYEVVINGQDEDGEDAARILAEEQAVRAAHFYNDEDKVGADDEQSPNKLYTVAFYLALAIAPFDAAQSGRRKLLLDRPVSEFLYFCNNAQWSGDKKTPDMRLIVRDIRRDNLPSYIFGDRPRPPKLKRAKPAKTGSPEPPIDQQKRSRIQLNQQQNGDSADCADDQQSDLSIVGPAESSPATTTLA